VADVIRPGTGACMGSIWADYDNDGFPDLFVYKWGKPELFHNNAGKGFDRVTDRAGLPGWLNANAACWLDYDRDGRLDLFVAGYWRDDVDLWNLSSTEVMPESFEYAQNGGRKYLLRNRGDGTFEDVTARAGVASSRWTTAAGFGDLDGDGDLDLVAVTYVEADPADVPDCRDEFGKPIHCAPDRFPAQLDHLFRNDGDGTFTDVSEASGVTRASGAGLGVVGADFNEDGRSDFYVANDGTANHLWLNRGDGTFVDGALMAGAAFNEEGGPEGSMGLAVGDPDGDEDLDIFVTNITRETHAYYVNLGNGQFEDRRRDAALAAATAPYTGFGTDWFDFDGDGRLDLFVANGAVTIQDVLRPGGNPFGQPNQLLRQLESGRFEDVTARAGAALEPQDVSRGAAFGDVDNDGDVDVLVTNNGGPVQLLLNQASGERRGPTVRLEGVGGNRQALGARVALRLADGRTLWRRVRTDGSYLSSSDPRVHFGLGEVRTPAAVIVVWPGGDREEWNIDQGKAMMTLKQGTGDRKSPGRRRADQREVAATMVRGAKG
jgi:hypothetical protein